MRSETDSDTDCGLDPLRHPNNLESASRAAAGDIIGHLSKGIYEMNVGQKT